MDYFKQFPNFASFIIRLNEMKLARVARESEQRLWTLWIRYESFRETVTKSSSHSDVELERNYSSRDDSAFWKSTQKFSP